MDLTPWAPLIAVGGVIVGASFAFIGQWLTRRQTSKLSIADRKAALRDDRRNAIFDFLDIMQKVEHLVDEEDQGFEKVHTSVVDPSLKSEMHHQLWFKQKCVEVICSEKLVEASLAYVLRMREIMFRNNPYELDPREQDGWSVADIWSHMDNEKQAFIKLARLELFENATYEDKVKEKEQLQLLGREELRVEAEKRKRAELEARMFVEDDDEKNREGKST